MEGPSIVIATREFEQFFFNKIIKAEGTAPLDWEKFPHNKLLSAASWGKHLILSFSHITLRIHFLMFGSYRIDNPRENRIPKMQLTFKDHEIYFYSCAIKVIDDDYENNYDFSVDVMSDQWDTKAAVKKMMAKKDSMVCDLLMDQEIFSGVGNIIKNEVLFRLKIHPEEFIQNLSTKEVLKLTEETARYSHEFYEWKINNVLKKNWKIFRKPLCPVCGLKVTKEATGKLKRISHYCSVCQSKKSDVYYL